jgi:hypothetical protein
MKPKLLSMAIQSFLPSPAYLSSCFYSQVVYCLDILSGFLGARHPLDSWKEIRRR